MNLSIQGPMNRTFPIKRIEVSVYTIPTDAPEADGTFSWSSTTMVLVEISAGNQKGIGYSYCDDSAARLIQQSFVSLLKGRDALAISELWTSMLWRVRNVGRAGIASSAISAVDIALWDLKAKLLGVSLVALLSKCRDRVPVYGSGGFTSYSVEKLQQQLGGWVAGGIRMVKMKVGSHPEEDVGRVQAAREAIGPDTQLFVDANGAYSCKQALAMAEKFGQFEVGWFEEPVSSDDLKGLCFVREHAPAPMEVAAGEYGYDHYYFRQMLEAGAVDVLQADATRCGGITGFLHAASLAQSFQIPFSAHTAPSIHCHAACALTEFRHIEYFHDHARVEKMFFDGAAEPVNGYLIPDLDRPGIGLDLKRRDAERFAA